VIGSVLVQALAQFLACLEVGDNLGIDADGFAGPRIAPGACAALLDGKGTETAQFHPVASGKCCCDFVEDGCDDAFGITLQKMRISVREALDQL